MSVQLPVTHSTTHSTLSHRRCRGSDVQDDDNGVVDDDTDDHIYGCECMYSSELSPQQRLTIYLQYDTSINNSGAASVAKAQQTKPSTIEKDKHNNRFRLVKWGNLKGSRGQREAASDTTERL